MADGRGGRTLLRRTLVLTGSLLALWTVMTACTGAGGSAPLATPYPTLERPLPTLTPGPPRPAEFSPTEKAVVSRAAPLFAQHCAACHGDTGRGDGGIARTLNPRPANFHDQELIRRRSPVTFYRAIRKGVLGTSMLGYEGTFSEQELWDLVFYVRALGLDQTSVTTGAALYAQHCATCHGAAGQGATAGRLADPRMLAGRTGYSLFNATSGGLPSVLDHNWSNLSESERWSIIEAVWTFMYDP